MAAFCDLRWILLTLGGFAPIINLKFKEKQRKGLPEFFA
jgi:hypothetical protein